MERINKQKKRQQHRTHTRMQTSTQTDKMPSRNENHNHLTTSIAPTPTPATAPKFTKFKQKKWTSAKKAKLATKKDEYTHRPFFPSSSCLFVSSPKRLIEIHSQNSITNFVICGLFFYLFDLILFSIFFRSLSFSVMLFVFILLIRYIYFSLFGCYCFCGGQ